MIRDNPESFYNGSLANKIVRDIRKRGGIITLQDLREYKVIRRKAIINKLNDMTWYTAPPPASGPVITLILNILKGKEPNEEPSKEISLMGDQVNFVVIQPKFSLRHYISVADNDARFIIVIASDWLLIVVLYSGPIMCGNMATVSRAYSSISQI